MIFKAKNELPCYFNSIITPKGDIYLTGGAEGILLSNNLEDRRCREIYRYDQKKNTLDFVCNMLNERSSHAICYMNNCIYLIGGFTKKEGFVMRECEVFYIDKQKCQSIAPLNTPSANSCATAFNDEYIFRFGGV